MPKEDWRSGSRTLVWVTRGLWICHQGPREERGACGRWAGGWGWEKRLAPGGGGGGTHLDEEVAHAQSSAPCHATLVHRLQILQRREGRGGGELLDGGLRCRWEEPAGSEGRGWRGRAGDGAQTQVTEASP